MLFSDRVSVKNADKKNFDFFFHLKSFFSSMNIEKPYFVTIPVKKTAIIEIMIFGQSHGLTPLENVRFLVLFKTEIFSN